jgi:mono/diheme cytochrome c family protein
MRALILIAAAATLQAQTPSAPNGKKLFDSYGCYQCHDHDGHGGAGARLAPNPIPLAAFSRYVRQPTGVMPPYTKKVVTDQELADIYAYLQSIPKPPDAKTIPALNH